jgi:dTDP-6-deoxy-L-talose 4-dehydrogenase (NAD+)
MPTIHLIGSEGFIGRAVQREVSGDVLHCWSHSQSDPDHHFDLLDPTSWDPLLEHRPSHVVLLSWPGLPNYGELFHVTRNLPACIDLIERLSTFGLKRIVITGTCYEYGMQNGPLKEDQATDPQNCYAIAKDSLRRVSEKRCAHYGIQWCWGRIFYPYGNGQNPNSLLPSLDQAIENGETSFAMSSGRQLRDFIAVEDVAASLLCLVQHPGASGVFNIGSGEPLSLREMAERRIGKASSNIRLDLGTFPDRADEPTAFWADITKTSRLLGIL